MSLEPDYASMADAILSKSGKKVVWAAKALNQTTSKSQRILTSEESPKSKGLQKSLR